MKFGVHLMTNLTSEWNSQYIQYQYMKEMLEKAVVEAPVLVNTNDDDDSDSNLFCEQYFLHVDEEFFEFCEKQVTKINTFFAEKLAELEESIHTYGALRRFTTLTDEIEYRKLMYGEVSPARKSSIALIQKSNKIGQSNNNRYRNHKSSMKISMNRTLPDRFIYKYNKFLSIKLHIDTATFYTSTAVTELIRDVEKIYIDELESGDRSRAMKRLRVPPLEEKQSSIVTFRLGIFIGIICVLLPMIIILIVVLNKSQSGIALAWREALHLYRSSFLIIFQIILASINIYGWSSSGVNHILIFEIDPRNHLTYQQLLELGTFLCVFWCLSFIAFILTSYLDFYPFLQPLIFLILMVLFIINPLPILYRSARYWLLKKLGLVCSAAFHRIHFADNWLCNQLTSIELAFYDLEFFFCFYFSNHQWWSTNLTLPSSSQNIFCTGWSKYLLQSCLLATPSLLRLTQCLRRYYDTKLKFPHLVNAGKYSVSIIVAITNSLRRANIAFNQVDPKRPQNNPFVYPWIIAAFINSTYKLIWDVKMDWGLFHKNAGENRFLRDHIIYSSKNYYYYAIIQDLVFRYSWTVNIFIHFNSGAAEYSDVIGFGFGLLELIRRFSWNFFRLENEHLNNCGRYRVIRDISIKPIATGIDFALADSSKLSKTSSLRNRYRIARCQTIIEENNMVTGDNATMDDLENNIVDFVNNQLSAYRTTTVSEVNTINQTLENISFRRCHSLSSLNECLDLT
ncbi:unnamed protein product [Rotaria sordida]|uniref:Xenotropic and polytropic retrovirus receptor 1 n=1 Tax=Rotaria sordida TaxID=392033 RepID=A0A814VI32_9BILA|nr:unnamed protein product [Rotaria sordida]CAF1454301.1 unnamed protein product [Rotaria sordida]